MWSICKANLGLDYLALRTPFCSLFLNDFDFNIELSSVVICINMYGKSCWVEQVDGGATIASAGTNNISTYVLNAPALTLTVPGAYGSTVLLQNSLSTGKDTWYFIQVCFRIFICSYSSFSTELINLIFITIKFRDLFCGVAFFNLVAC